MEKTPSIAVVIPNYNDSEHLVTCLDSIINQEVPADQIIVVDDSSTDNSREIIREKINCIAGAELIVNQTNLGTMATLNEGLKRAYTNYVLFLSSNDYLKSEILKKAKSRILSDNYPGIWSAMVLTVDDNGLQSDLYPSPVISLKDARFSPDQCIRFSMLVGHWFTGTTALFHRETLKAIGGFDIAYKGLADMLAALTVASIKGASFSPEPLGVMRLHAGGLTWQTSIDLPGLDAILDRMAYQGPKLSPRLFTKKYCDVMQRRIRFTAIRAFHDNRWQEHLCKWHGTRYRLMNLIIPYLGRFRKLQLSVAFLLIRPPLDLFTILWYRIFRVFKLKLKIKHPYRL